jgi:hypothetical protein
MSASRGSRLFKPIHASNLPSALIVHKLFVNRFKAPGIAERRQILPGNCHDDKPNPWSPEIYRQQ